MYSYIDAKRQKLCRYLVGYLHNLLNVLQITGNEADNKLPISYNL